MSPISKTLSRVSTLYTLCNKSILCKCFNKCEESYDCFFNALHSSVQHVNERGVGRASHVYVGKTPAGNIYTPAAILYTSAFPAKALRIFRMLKCATIMSKTSFRHQSNSLVQPTIQLTWERHQCLCFRE